ncbi:hypothetical protein CRG98_034326 [Punica granatum]|uniref:Uncharacterized protein n=1 Tax=Punica granatum TaxID=22663 RepID=A0A2I0INJ7_PUNGR|nr:hypothetical protein CRG98_034326 [Punica granatum]
MGSRNAVEGPNDLSHESYLKLAPSNHLDDDADKSGINETPQVSKSKGGFKEISVDVLGG